MNTDHQLKSKLTWPKSPKSMKLKQKWNRSTYYSQKCCFYWVITWKLIFRGWGGEVSRWGGGEGMSKFLTGGMGDSPPPHPPSSTKNSFVGPSFATPLEPLTHHWNVISLSLFCRYYVGRCSSELAQQVPLPLSWGRSTRYSDRLNDFSVTIPRCYLVSFLIQLDPGFLCQYNAFL